MATEVRRAPRQERFRPVDLPRIGPHRQGTAWRRPAAPTTEFSGVEGLDVTINTHRPDDFGAHHAAVFPRLWHLPENATRSGHSFSARIPLTGTGSPSINHSDKSAECSLPGSFPRQTTLPLLKIPWFDFRPRFPLLESHRGNAFQRPVSRTGPSI